MDPGHLMTRSLQNSPWGTLIARIMSAALRAVDPEKAVERHMQRFGEQLICAARSYDLGRIKRVLVIGGGKAGYPMATAAARILGEHLTEGVVIVKEGYAVSRSGSEFKPAPNLTIVEAGHPLPDKRGVRGTNRIIDILSRTTPDDLVVCLISGGGSALMLSPCPGLKLSDLQRLTEKLLASGATIVEINRLRKHLDRVKGGRLARLAAPARLITLVLSDVIGDPLETIASGPTAPDPSTYSDAYQVLEKYQLLDQVPISIVNHLERGMNDELSESPKPGDPIFDSVQNEVIGNNFLAGEAALKQAKIEGLDATLLTTHLQGEARHVGPVLAAIARQVIASGHPSPRQVCLIAGGETTVTLIGSGKGGRNQELALSAVEDLAGLPGTTLVTLATDGGDGPTDAAGAVVTGDTLKRAKRAGMEPIDFLNQNDAYHFFEPLGDLIKCGPTGTNVNDLNFLFVL
jgi:hydroxypyruvate reductase